MIKASDFITKVQGVKAKAGYIVKDSQSSSVLYFFNLSDSSIIPLSDVYIPDTQVQEPAYHGSSGGSASMAFYKCVAVNSDSTWSGYKAVLNQQGYYQFQSESTEGLLYNSHKTTPTVGKVYSNGCLITGKLFQNILSDGLVFYAPLQSSVSADVGGLATVVAGTPSFQTVDGITALRCTGSTRINYAATTDLPDGNKPRTMSFWVYVISSELTSSFYHVCGYGEDNNNAFQFGFEWGQPMLYRPYIKLDGTIYGQWTNFIATYSGTTVKLYKNGVLAGTSSWTANTTRDKVFVGYCGTQNDFNYKGYVRNFRIYDKVVSSDVIQELASELTPTSN